MIVLIILLFLLITLIDLPSLLQKKQYRCIAVYLFFWLSSLVLAVLLVMGVEVRAPSGGLCT
jgi:hypothetical protein